MNRVADVLFDPLFLAVALLALSYVHLRRRPRLAMALPAAALGLLVFFGIPDVANELQRRLEQPPLTTMKPGVTYDAVIVLGGSMNSALTAETGQLAFNESAERLLTGFDLLRTNRAKSAILSGGAPAAGSNLEAEAVLMAQQLEEWGIDRSRLALDVRSTNTHENAIESVRIAREHGWTRDLLVTSAAHMERARGCFVHEGLSPDTLAVDFVGYPTTTDPRGWLPRAPALAVSTGVIREKMGRLIDRLRGWTD